MGTKKTPAKAGRSSMTTRRSASKAIREEQAVTPKNRSTKKPDATFSHHLPTEDQRKSNGRVLGRSLIVWGRPRMADKLLLHLQYECQRAKIELPWNAIAHRLHPGSSGAAVNQYLVRLRRELIAEGHMVPPLPHPRGRVDSTVRGYILEDENGDDKTTVRPVTFSEKLEDRRFSLPGAFDHDMKDETPASVAGDSALADDDEGDPFIDSPTPAGPIFRTPNNNRYGFIDSSPSFNDHESVGFGSGSFSRAAAQQPTIPGNEHGQDQKIVLGTPMTDMANDTLPFPDLQGSMGIAPPMTPTRVRPAYGGMPYNYGIPQFSPMSYVSPGHGGQYSAPMMSPYDTYPRSAHAFPSWPTMPPINTQSFAHPSLQPQQQTETPSSSPTGAEQDDQTQQTECAESDVDELIDFEPDA